MATDQSTSLPETASTVQSTPETGTTASSKKAATVSVPKKPTADEVTAAAAVTTIEKKVASTAALPYTDQIAKLSASSQLKFAQLYAYIQATASNCIVTDAAGGRLSAQLSRSIHNIIENDPAEFNAAFGILVNIIRAYRKTQFSDSNALRWTANHANTRDDRSSLEALMNLLLQLADATDPKKVKATVNFDIACRYLTDAAKQRVIAWIG